VPAQPPTTEPAIAAAAPPPLPELPLPSREAAKAYRAPRLLRDLRLLDALELTGTTQEAGRWLAVSQPTVSRRSRRLVEEFGMPPRRQAKRLPQGSTVSLRQLRLAARWHRFEAGVAALATDPLHGWLLAELNGLLPVPQRFRCGHAWLDLVRSGVVDAALLSSLEREPPTLCQEAPLLRGAAEPWPAPREPEQLHLGHWPLQGLCPLETPRERHEHLWLLLPPEWPAVPVLRLAVESLRQKAKAAGALT